MEFLVKKLIKASAENINISNHSCIDDVKSFELNIISWISFITQSSYIVQSICNIWCSASPPVRANDLNWIPLARGSNRLKCSRWKHWKVVFIIRIINIGSSIENSCQTLNTSWIYWSLRCPYSFRHISANWQHFKLMHLIRYEPDYAESSSNRQ